MSETLTAAFPPREGEPAGTSANDMSKLVFPEPVCKPMNTPFSNLNSPCHPKILKKTANMGNIRRTVRGKFVNFAQQRKKQTKEQNT